MAKSLKEEVMARRNDMNELKVMTWEFIAGPDDEKNMGQVVRITKPMPGAWQRESAGRMTVSLGYLTIYTN